MAGVFLCDRCNRQTRPKRTSRDRFPGTISYGIGKTCGTCIRGAREAGRKKEPAVVRVSGDRAEANLAYNQLQLGMFILERRRRLQRTHARARMGLCEVARESIDARRGC